MQELCAYWADEYDWRAPRRGSTRSRSSAPRSTGSASTSSTSARRTPDALPLVITHGWPGSVVEFLEGDRAADRPGRPRRRRGRRVPRRVPVAARLRVQRQAGRHRLGRRAHRRGVGAADGPARLRPLRRPGRRLGRERHHAPSASSDPEHVAGIHLNMPLGAARPGDARRRSPSGAGRARRARSTTATGTRATRSSSRPGRRRSATALVDSPAGQCAWIVEKFWAWTDCDGDPENVLTRDELLDNVMLYWLPGHRRVVGPAVLGELQTVNAWIAGRRAPIDVPTGCSIFPKEIFRPSRRWAEKRFTDIRYWNELDRAATSPPSSSPTLFVDEVRACFRELPGVGLEPTTFRLTAGRCCQLSYPGLWCIGPKGQVTLSRQGSQLRPRSRRGSWRRGGRTCAPPRGCGRASGSAPSGRH